MSRSRSSNPGEPSSTPSTRGPSRGCAAEVSQRIAEAVFAALTPAIPDKLFAAPAGTSGNFALGGQDPLTGRGYVMYLFTGGGYGGSADGDGLSNGCSTIGISKTPPVEIVEQRFPVLFEEYALHEGSGGPGRHRGGFGVRYRLKLRRGTSRASFVMDHGRTGPRGALGGHDGGLNRVVVERNGETYHPPHLSKDQDIRLAVGDTVTVCTPGGGGFGDPIERDPELVARDLRRSYYTSDQAREMFGVVVDPETLAVDAAATAAERARARQDAAGPGGGPAKAHSIARRGRYGVRAAMVTRLLESMDNLDIPLTTLAKAAGCAAKIGQADLAAALAHLPESDGPRVLIGHASGDDAAVIRLTDDLALVETVDIFPPIVDDAFDYGRIAAANALSDIYAMGARPVSALSVVAWPVERLGLERLGRVLEGAPWSVRGPGSPSPAATRSSTRSPSSGSSSTARSIRTGWSATPGRGRATPWS